MMSISGGLTTRVIGSTGDDTAKRGLRVPEANDHSGGDHCMLLHLLEQHIEQVRDNVSVESLLQKPYL